MTARALAVVAASLIEDETYMMFNAILFNIFSPLSKYE
jgi:hypothetical protein